MDQKKRCLPGLRAEDYIHPQESQFRASSNFSVVNGALDKLNDVNVALIRRTTLGKHIAINEQTAPDVYGIVADVCRILDYGPVPKVYVCHEASQAFFCAGGEETQITMSDYILKQFDRDMLYFAFGNVISMFKAGHVRLANVCALMPPSPEAMVVVAVLEAYLRVADLSSDRGGLLACQNFSAAARVILWDAGIPIRELRELDEDGIIRLCEAYIQAVDADTSGWITEVAKGLRQLGMNTMPPAYRMQTLLEWYRSGYSDMLQGWQ